MAGEAKAGAGRPPRTEAAESQVTDDASRGQPKQKLVAEPLPLPVTKPVICYKATLLHATLFLSR